MAEIDQKLKKLYGNEFFQVYEDDPKRDAWYQNEYDRISKLRPEGGKVFDVGCGLGLFLSYFDDKKWDKYGMDVSELAIAQARQRGIKVKDYASGYDYPDESFDVIIFRGVIQHIDTPFAVIKKCVALLKPGGLMVFLSTPNANGIFYRLFKTNPVLRSDLNFLIPSDIMLQNALKNFGLKVFDTRYPYLETPYARPIIDHLKFLLRCIGFDVKFPFWGNLMEVYAEKPSNASGSV